MLLFMPLLQALRANVPEFFGFVAASALAAITFSALGVAVAARFKSMTVFPIISNAMLLPVIFFLQQTSLYPLTLAPALVADRGPRGPGGLCGGPDARRAHRLHVLTRYLGCRWRYLAWLHRGDDLAASHPHFHYG